MTPISAALPDLCEDTAADGRGGGGGRGGGRVMVLGHVDCLYMPRSSRTIQIYHNNQINGRAEPAGDAQLYVRPAHERRLGAVGARAIEPAV